MPSTKYPPKIEVAVVGGGMGGLCLAIGLLKHPHISVQIYEAASKFAEIGAGVAFGPNAQRALALISPETEQAYLRQATRNMWKEMANIWFEYRYGMGPREGELMAAPWNETGQRTVHRAKFLDEFVSLIPPEVAHFGKRLERLHQDESGRVQLHFKDRDTVLADCVIGADGVHSVVREHLLGADHPALKPQFSGSVAYRGLIPMKEACDAIGERYAQNAFLWTGKDGVVMTYPIDFGNTMNVVASKSTYENWDGPWVQKADFATVEADYANWGQIPQKIVKLLDRPETMAWSLWDHPPAPTYYRGNIAMMGDAAHASTPFQGQGAAQAIEDSFVLESLLGHVHDVSHIPHAFHAYDKIRRPRSQRVVRTSREANELCCLRLPGVLDDAQAFKENMEWRMDWIWHRDIAGERDEALIIFDKLCNGETVS